MKFRLFFGGVITSLAKTTASISGVAVKRILVKMSVKFALKSVPVVGEVYIVANLPTAVIDDLMVVWDTITTKNKVDFIIPFPIEITKISPSSIQKGRAATIHVEGKGLDPIVDSHWFGFGETKYYMPKVIITDTETKETIKTYLDKNYQFTIPKDFLESAHKKLSISIQHKHLDTQWANEFVPITVSAPNDISIVNQLTITDITPSSGNPGKIVSINGTGFSTNMWDNLVYFTTTYGASTGFVVNASSTQIQVQVPMGTITGDVWVNVGNQDSNVLNFTVSSNQVRIEFGDNGSANDDTFSLDFNNGETVKTTKHPTRMDYAIVNMNTGVNYTVKLTGIQAPDEIGTYYIKFPSEVEVLGGSDSLSGSDLTSGVVKTYRIRLKSNRSMSKPINQSINYTPSLHVDLQPEVRQ